MPPGGLSTFLSARSRFSDERLARRSEAFQKLLDSILENENMRSSAIFEEFVMPNQIHDVSHLPGLKIDEEDT